MARLSVCYVIVSRGQDDYPAMACVSCQALRRVHPDAKVTLLCDKTTEAVLRKDHGYLLDLADAAIGIEVEALPSKATSRYVKTTMRRWIEGDFLYLDSDALPVRPFAEVFDTTGDLAAVQDRTHLNPLDPSFPPHFVPLYQQLGWRYPLPRYF